MKRFCALLTLALMGDFAASTISHTETLQQAVQTMIETNPDACSLAHNRLARDEEVRQARANYFPTLDVEPARVSSGANRALTGSLRHRPDPEPPEPGAV